MNSSIQELIIQRMDESELSVFSISDFLDLGSYNAIRQAIVRLQNEKVIKRIIRGIYYKPVYNERFKLYELPNIENVAKAIARQNNWNICPSGNYALNLLGLSTQIPAKYIFISDGTYKEYIIEGTKLEFKHSRKKEISNYSYKTMLIIQALKLIGNGNITEIQIEQISKRLTKEEKEKLLVEGKTTNIWMYEIIKKICGVMNV